MDKIHHPDDRPWISDHISPGEYFKDYVQLVEETKPLKNTSDLKDKWMMQMMGMDPEDKDLFAKVEDAMDLEKLALPHEVEPMQINDPIQESIHGDDIPKFYSTKITPSGKSKLKTLHLQDKWLAATGDKNADNNARKARRRRISKHTNNNWFTAEKPHALTKNLNWNAIDREVVYVIRVYRPFMHMQPYQYGLSSQTYTAEIWILGHHTLADLRDMIWCQADLNVVGRQQVDTVQQPAVRAKDVYRSGFIYIEGTFYNDERDSRNIDYSKVIRRWAEDDPKRNVGPFTTGVMEETFIKDLRIRLGYPYVYQHQGDHEHLFSVNDIRLLAPSDPQSVKEYPLLRSVGGQTSRFCHICQSAIAVWVTLGNERVPEDPSFFCGYCYKHFNFRDKKRIGSFKEYRYFDVNTI